MAKIPHNSLSALRSAVILLCRGLLRLYQWVISPLFPPACRFHPSCSEYAKQAITTHGPVRGLWLAAKRLLRCHPWGGSGSDPVPERKRSC